jgi:hypothetical protein
MKAAFEGGANDVTLCRQFRRLQEAKQARKSSAAKRVSERLGGGNSQRPCAERNLWRDRHSMVGAVKRKRVSVFQQPIEFGRQYGGLGQCGSPRRASPQISCLALRLWPVSHRTWGAL